ncbi:plexin-B2-like isoform X2 [Mya arenaria]|uniref:plexin-B2-like isoform X2 n=1 Tax=Mya arenaria TaxID=6604 RepID=UPI0022E5CAC3|nr:plexin-B2-like isoform X2 [Mya arenaria]
MHTITLLTLTILAAVIESETEIVRRGKALSKIVPNKGSFYIADGNEVYKLNTRFDEVEKANINEHGNDNTITLILVDEKNESLIVCGSICKCFGLDQFNMKSISDAVVINLHAQLSVQGIVTESFYEHENHSILTVAASLANNEINLEIMKQYDVLNSFEKNTASTVLLKEHIEINYKAVVQNDGHIFFFTNQQERNSLWYISKIAKVCKDKLTTFVDLPLQCNANESYNLVQDAILVGQNNSITLFVTFAKGKNLEEIESDHGILCSADFQVVEQNITEEQKRVMDCKHNHTDSYLNRKCLNNSSTNFDVMDCTADVRFYSNGESHIKLDFVDMTNVAEGYVTTLSKTKLEGSDVILAGTANGFVLKYVLDEDNKISKFESFQIEKDVQTPVKSIVQIKENMTFASTSSKVFKFSSTDCSEFRTCEETMAGKNPLCGWCVYSQSATRRNDCSYWESQNHWLSALSKCPSLNLQPSGIPVNINETVMLNVDNLPEHLATDAYFCKVEDDPEALMPVTVKEGKPISCTIVGREHKMVAVSLIVEHNSVKIPIANASFLFYICSTFERCGKCVETFGANCTWNTDNGTCSSSEADEPNRVNQVSDCPHLERIHSKYIPSGVDTNLTLEIGNLNKLKIATEFSIHVEFHSKTFNCSDITNGSSECTVNRMTSMKKETLTLEVFYKLNSKGPGVYLDNPNQIDVIVYNCSILSQGKCNFCNALKSEYICHWPLNSGDCKHGQKVGEGYTCPMPEITKILPRDGYTGEGTIITVYGNEFGTENDTIVYGDTSVNPVVVNKRCISVIESNYRDSTDAEDFNPGIRESFQCTLGRYRYDKQNKTGFSIYDVMYKSEEPTVLLPIWKGEDDVYVQSMEPKKGPAIGGTVISLFGKNLGIGNRVVQNVKFLSREDVLPTSTCKHSKVQSEHLAMTVFENFYVTCEVSIDVDREPGTNMTFEELEIPVEQQIKGKHVLSDLIFKFLPNPEIRSIHPTKGFLSGGTILTVKGQHLNSSNVGTVSISNEKETQENCIIDPNSADQVLCKVPNATVGVRNALESNTPSNSQRKKRSSHCDGCVTVDILVKLDGVESHFTISYYHDPSINKFDENVLLYQTDQQYLEIKGENLNLVAEMHDINVTIGLGECNVVELTGTYMRCKAPSSQPQPGIPGATLPEVNVTIGNIQRTVGYIEYQKKFENVLIIAGAAAGTALFLLVLVVAFFVCKYRKVGSKAKALEKQLNDLELEIKHVAKEEFLDMQTSMSTVNRNLIEQGFPYHSYQQYACNAMFATDYLMSDPVMSDELRARARTGMERFQGLLENKFFLVSLITTMEKQKHFFIKEKSNFAGNLCAIMMGRMDYMHEVLQVLITQLVEDPSSKRGVKSLFRRSESITEKLLSNWLSLCLYPHLKDHTGSLLYLLYIATRKTMEAGPIDALTNDAKYTLSEEKLLRKYQGSATDEETTDVKFEAKALTLNVVVDNGEEIYPCKALDCDTVNQVKAKCLDQIYVNYPASQLPVDPTELLLEWHAGFSGRMILRDKDNTSKRDGEWIRVNTLAHYAVADQSNMALVDPRNAELSQQEDYVNLAQIDPCFDVNSMGSDQPLTAECSTSHDEENPMELKQWHLLKDDDANKKEKSAIDELYLNRLITTKLSLVKYIDDLFSLVLESSKCPPPVKFLYDFLDDLAEKQKIDPDTLHAWKSHSYSIRIWAMLIKTPSILFDINAPSYVSESLDVISQVFIESFSRTEQAVSKESPTQKLIFRNELTKFRTHVQEFYKNVKENVQKPDELGQYLTSINRNQQETTFNKNAALYRLYEQIKPYTDEILDDLSICQETRCLQLNKKLDDIFSMMEE